MASRFIAWRSLVLILALCALLLRAPMSRGEANNDAKEDSVGPFHFTAPPGWKRVEPRGQKNAVAYVSPDSKAKEQAIVLIGAARMELLPPCHRSRVHPVLSRRIDVTITRRADDVRTSVWSDESLQSFRGALHRRAQADDRYHLASARCFDDRNPRSARRTRQPRFNATVGHVGLPF